MSHVTICSSCGAELIHEGVFVRCPNACVKFNPNVVEREVGEPLVVPSDEQERFPDLYLKGPQDVLRDLGDDPKVRKDTPITSGVLDYFPLALAGVARISKAGNDQHNPGQPLTWARGKSFDHADCIARHLIQRGTPDTDGLSHTGKLAWRALALYQEELEAQAGFKPKG